jgi:hypothetical protein
MTSSHHLLACAALVAAACSASPTGEDPAGAQVAAASEIARRIATDPGPLETICVAYSGSWDDPPLPADVPPIAFAYADGCQEVDGQLFAFGPSPDGDRSRAIWLGVGVPEPDGSTEPVVRVFTSTGSDDAASYACRVRWGGAAWSVERCELEAIG